MRWNLVLVVLALTPACVEDEYDSVEGAEQELGGQTHVVQWTPYDSKRTKALAVTCPFGWVMTSAGYAASNSAGALQDIAVNAEPATWDTWELHGTDFSRSRSWRLGTDATCVPAPTGFGIHHHDSYTSPGYTKQLQMSCPPGQLVLGAGYSAREPLGGRVDARQTYSMPSWDGTSWLMNVHAFHSGDWYIHGSILCADPVDLPNYFVSTGTTPVDLTPSKWGKLWCPTGMYATGGGWAALDATYAILPAIPIYDVVGIPSHTWTAWARVDPAAVTVPWQLQIGVICTN
jgi:hypothetical protein